MTDTTVYKVCTKCKESKSVSLFTKDAQKKDGLCSICKQCKSRRVVPLLSKEEKRNRNLERLRKYHKEHYSTEKNRERKNSESYIESQKKYRNSEKGKHALRLGRLKRRIQLEVENTLTAKEWRETLADYGNRCAYCNEKKDNLEQDHITPISKGGSHTKENVVPACRKCNASKHNKPLILWMAQVNTWTQP